ncbi:sigma-54-dependent transcriptional regulator [Halioglobus pacificus]|uniref:Sigma-54-dependent Fis family transcriptional regulator n=1 Tax=Parahalioglobus pacificus TaxID=930806 RepID=A0A919CHT6_9GAMM|nr:sigma-54 dependent transcriptional regulator [Halioglobus pacificus]NQY02679.1 sigma-54-dependent Fis family transcriptional regulator [Halieaceae bacterium]GHD26942.1 sigma-54-dependent Fis family transcriptional regulator [Halioglobus pacificus]
MPGDSHSILIVDDDEDILTAGRLLLKREFGSVNCCNDPHSIPEQLATQRFDAILLDMNFSPGESSGEQGFYWLRRILELDPDAVVVMITAHGSMDLAVEAMKHGATDFVAKPWQNEKVVATLSAAVKLRRSRTETATLKRRNQALVSASGAGDQSIRGQSAEIREVLSVIKRTAPTDANILVMGENGTGKELAARLLHQQSQRADNVFMSVDLGSVSETVFESELFGHRKGAFTGAATDRVGRLEAANGGTLFLDEIGNIPLNLQAKLLTVLEQRAVTPVGRNEAVPIDIRVIAATNVPREQLADEARFRQDLLFRLNTVELTLPPLRARREDIPEIANYYADLYSQKYQKPMRDFSPEALSAMQSYAWPGNVRALRHAVERAVILAEGDSISELDLQLSAADAVKVAQGAQATDVDADDLNLERMEKRTIQAALKRHRYNISHAARELGLTRAALYRRMEKHDL